MTAVESAEIEKQAAALPLQTSKKARSRQKDEGSAILPGMEHFVSLARKVRRPELLRVLLEQASEQPLDTLQTLTEKTHGVLPIAARNTLFATVAPWVQPAQEAVEHAAERILLLGDEYGDLAVRDVLDPDQADDAAILADPTDKFSRALHVYLRQAFPAEGQGDDRRFDHAESRQDMRRQAQSEKYSSHYLGPKGAQPQVGQIVESEVRNRLTKLFPQIAPEEIVIEIFEKRDGRHPQKPIVLYTLKATFNGSRIHFQQVANGEVVDHEEPAVTEVQYAWKPAEGTLGVFCEDKEVRPELAAIFRDVVLGGSGDIASMPIREFALLGFSTSAMMDRIKKDRIDGIESISIQHIVVAKPRSRQFDVRGKRITRNLSSDFRIRRHRFDDRNVYEIAREDGKFADLTDYEILQVKLSVRIAKQRHHQAHNVSVEITAPNGFGDRSKTEKDKELIFAQLVHLGCAHQY